MGEVLAMKVLKKRDVLKNDQVDNTRTEKRVMAAMATYSDDSDGGSDGEGKKQQHHHQHHQQQHPYLVRLRYAFQTRTKLFLVMDYYPGGSIFAHLRQAA